MAKELYLYAPIYSFISESLVASMEENKNEDIIIRANTPGGSVYAGWGIIAKMLELQKSGSKVTIKVDGTAMSMGAVMLAFADEVEALDVSTIMLHRADMYVATPEDQAFLDRINKDIKSKITKRINGDKLKEIKGVSIEELFNPETRIDVYLTAKEAKDIGLINKVVKVNPVEVEAFHERILSLAASGPTKNPENKNPKIMNIELLLAQHPDVYAQVIARGAEQERERVGAWMVFNDVDPDAVKKGIESGKAPSVKEIAELSRKSFNAEALNDLNKDNPGAVKTEEVEAKVKTESEKKLADFEAAVDAELKK